MGGQGLFRTDRPVAPIERYKRTNVTRATAERQRRSPRGVAAGLKRSRLRCWTVRGVAWGGCVGAETLPPSLTELGVGSASASASLIEPGLWHPQALGARGAPTIARREA